MYNNNTVLLKSSHGVNLNALDCIEMTLELEAQVATRVNEHVCEELRRLDMTQRDVSLEQ